MFGVGLWVLFFLDLIHQTVFSSLFRGVSFSAVFNSILDVRRWALGVRLSELALSRTLFHGSIRQRHRKNSAVEKIIYFCGRWSWIAEDRIGVGSIDVFVS